MKRSLFLFMILLFSTLSQAQSPNYKDLWAKIDKFEAEGLPQSALKVIDDIEKQATKDNNHPQLVKTLIFKSKYALSLEEDAQLSIINDFKSQIATSNFPVKNILENLLANLYWQYFNQYRWQFYNRTKTDKKVDAIDFRTWDLQTLFNEIHLHLKASLANGLMLQQEALENYSVLLHEQKDSKIYRPTLFDFLSHNALEFYKTNETQITKPAYKFEIDNVDFLADAKTFSALQIESKDTTSLQLNALKIYQDLIRFHLKDELPLALAYVNIERLKFVKAHATFQDSEALLLKAFKIEGDRLKNNEVSGLYDFETASIYYQQSQTYQPKTNEKQRWKAKDALEICEQVISKFPESKGAENCAILKSQIEQFSFQITTENFLPIQQNARLLLSYKNLNAIKFNAYKVTEKQYKTFSNIYREDEQREFIKNLYANKIWKSNLKNEADYQRHTTEVFMPNLDAGRYLVVGFIEENEDAFAFATLQVTNMAYVETEALEHKIFQIINRNNGAPITNTKVEVSYASRVNKVVTKTYTTNNLGEIKINKDNSWYRNVNLKVQQGNDVAYFGDFYINQTYKQPEEKVSYKSFLFTDRSIYRPGQTVYFKAIAMETFNGKSEVLANEMVYAKLYNVNNEALKTLTFKTNEFGSVAGEFILPSSGLTGVYRIEFNTESNKYLRSNASFSVEEYKRPKFETKFTPVTETFKINDAITVKGTALAYAGSNITDAKVVYRVHRKVQYPRWYFWYRPYINSEPQEITHGETVTDANGEFEIIFKAIPDQSVDKNSLPVFNYEITADVTDLNGETRSATTVVNVGYHALLANLSIDSLLDKSKNSHNLTIDTKNLNGEFVPATGTVKIYKLQAPNTVLRERPWSAPDYQEISKTVFKDLFPHEAYNNEHNSSNWNKGELVLEKPFNTKNTKTIALGKIKKWQSGEYIITLESKDKFGQLVKDEVKTTLFSAADKVPADNKLLTIATDKKEYSVGDTANITIGSAAENILVTVSVEKNKNIISTEIIQLNANKKTISVPVTKADLGGFVVHYSFAAFNSFLSGSQAISVPYPNSNLAIETLTFRDKLQPGTDETWQFKVKGPDGEKVSSELLASMYDASLDQFKPHNWNFNPIQNRIYSAYSYRRAYQSFGIENFRVYNINSGYSYPQQHFDQWNWFGFNFGNNYALRYRRSASMSKKLSGQVAGVQIVADEMELEESALEDSVVIGYSSNKQEVAAAPMQQLDEDVNLKEEKTDFDNIQIRKNLQETAFFFPQLKTDDKGHVSFSFTTPEALTQWKLQLLAHTKTLESATQSFSTVTQKELMVIPNAPRFLREGDKITISTKIANLTENQLTGQAVLILTDAVSGKTIDSNLGNSENNKVFTVDAKGNTQVSWALNIPEGIQAVQYKIIAKSDTFSDGEQNALPVLSNRMLVTETLPMWVRSHQTKSFTLDKLMSNTSTSLTNHKLTLEMTSNPAWYAVQALPYLMEYPYECNEQTFSRYYANALASHIANSNPRIQEVFNQWKNTDALLSNLEKNEELKSILIQETPWLRDAQSETEQKKRIALLFDLNKMNNELQSAIQKLESNQLSSGAWAWFNGGYENRYITQHIITGFGHLNKLNVKTSAHSNMIENAISYLDKEFVKEYKDLKKYNKNVDLSKDHLSYTQLHYLYMRSFFSEVKKSKEVETIIDYYQTQIGKYWLNRSLYSKGLMALVSHRNSDSKTALKILKSLKETSITSEELGMYWKSNTNSWYWYQAPIETQALLIEAFGDIENDTETIDNLKIWLLKNKQTNRWKTTKATTEAVYALLLQGSDWLSVTDMVDVVIGGQAITPSKLESVKIEAGTGYYKTAWNTAEIKPEMGEVKISKKGKGIAWGSLYWQYFEDLDKITTAETPLKLSKKLFLKSNTDTGEEISEINSETDLKVGDLVRVRIELRSDRNMEFLHMKDMRASGLEPVNVISKYKWQDGLGYYESTKDASTNFFFDYLPKGVYVFEYDLRVNNAGNMSNGITTIQSMYAPEFSSHSEGVRISVNSK
ncbi:alpha-2-macroglobulin family protein [Algibacter pectinivorans]|uniref:Alpha-2-macroglobulin family N-terminal region n=1 Tax=Algibacter pectinivorans TaxID=870482 RepID=A0A1I1MC50_9FLAO|nr:MG2 domain-containing protein [Algibacter pectinivorans]SFC82765.1 Alpha-2-macroglobulin family N-terminal region [Algibacter pectinivorans]